LSATPPVPPRIRWAAERLTLEADHSVLEIGCGNGQLIELLCPRLSRGRLVAVERSAAMARRAAQRNRAWVDAGRLHIVEAALAQAGLEGERFDAIVAVNVNFFWQKAEVELALLRAILRPGGTLLVVIEPPAGQSVTRIAERARDGLERAGFVPVAVVFARLDTADAVALAASIADIR
jgi:cyclopropane fatty-acyl-phospholipid synthase-like methyltransferase